MRWIWLIICLISQTAIAGVKEERVRKFEMKDEKGASYTLNLMLDGDGRPQYFFRNIYTPVCNTGECKPVYINFYWDLLGNYTRFDFPAGEVLTKTDHREFMPHEYAKLQEILSRETSIFSELKMEDLVVKGTEKISDSANVKTGATLKTIKNDVIEGAVFTCYTLWHLAHGKTADEIRSITEGYTSPQLLHSFLQSNNHHYQYWAMEKVMDREGVLKAGFESDLEGIIRGRNIFTARFALQKIHAAYFTPARQQWLWETYTTTTYPLQMAILKKLGTVKLSEAAALKIAETLNAGNKQQFDAKLALLVVPGKASATLQTSLAQRLGEAEPEKAAAIYTTLQQMKSTNKNVLQLMKQYQHKTQQTEN